MEAIAEAGGGKPIGLDGVQGRTAVNHEPATVARRAEIGNIIAVKEASGNMSQIADVCASVPPGFTVLSGDDAITLGDWLGHLRYFTAAIGKMHFHGQSRHGPALRLDHDDWAAHLQQHTPPVGHQRSPARPAPRPAAARLAA